MASQVSCTNLHVLAVKYTNIGRAVGLGVRGKCLQHWLTLYLWGFFFLHFIVHRESLKLQITSDISKHESFILFSMCKVELQI